MRASRRLCSVISCGVVWGLGALPTPVKAQEVAPADVLAAYGVAGGTLQTLELPRAVTDEVSVPITLDGTQSMLRLRPHSVRGEDLQLVLVDESGSSFASPPISHVVRGTVEGWPGSVVAGSVSDGQLNAIVFSSDTGMVPGGYVIEPLGDGRHLVHRSDDLFTDERICGVDDSLAAYAGNDPVYQPGDLGTVPAMTCDVAIDTDFEYYEAKGSVELVFTQVENILGGVSALYQEYFAVELLLTTVVVRMDEADPFSSTVDPYLTLDELGAHWASEQAGFDPDVIQLFSGKDFPSLWGLGNLGGICSEENNVSLIEPFSPSGLLKKVRLAAHEFGHNFGANHCASQPDCGIMCPGSCGPIDQFGQQSTQTILHKKLTSSCLELAEELAPPVVTSVGEGPFPSAAVGGFFVVEGSGLITTVAVEVGDEVLESPQVMILGDGAIVVAAPTPTALGTVPVVVHTTVGSSNAGGLVYGPNSPPALLVPWSAPSGQKVDWIFGGKRGDTAVLLLSASNEMALTPGGTALLTGASVATIEPLNDAALGRHTLVAPASLAGLPLYSQVVMFDDDGLDDASGVRTTNIGF